MYDTERKRNLALSLGCYSLGGCLSFCSLSVTKPCIFTVFWALALLQFGHAFAAYGPPFFFFCSALAVHATQTEDAFTSHAHASRHRGQQWITDGISSGNRVANRCSSSRNLQEGKPWQETVRTSVASDAWV